MHKLVRAILVLLAMPICQSAEESKDSSIVLPNPKLLRCRGSDCAQLWLTKSSESKGIFPRLVLIDSKDSCLYGITAIYEGSISADDLTAALNGRYSQWAVSGFEKSSLKLWRVTAESFAIQLSVSTKADEKRGRAKAGEKRIIFLAFGGASACKSQ